MINVLARKVRDAISSKLFFFSKDGTGRLRDTALADDSRVFFLDLRPETLRRFFLHFDLDVVLSNFTFAQVELAGIFDKNTCI